MDEAEGGDVLVGGEDGSEELLFVGGDGYVLVVWVDVEKVEEGIGGVGVVTTEGLKTEMTVHKNDSVAGFEKIFSGGGAASSCTEVVEETNAE